MLNNFDITTLSSIPIRKKIYLIGGIFVAGIYIGVMLFGENSILALYKIYKEKKEITKEIESLKESNQKLQEEFFLLKQLEPKDNQ
ncbi:MAG: septum formation initiator family protein [Arcobacter sp.]|nr:septum formation initiator family protein [Arcobacter sp.]